MPDQPLNADSSAEWEWPGEPCTHHVLATPAAVSGRAPLEGFHASVLGVATDVRYVVLRSWFRDTKFSMSEFYGDLPDGGEISVRYSDLAWFYKPGGCEDDIPKIIKGSGLHTLAAAVFDISSEDAAKYLLELVTYSPPALTVESP